MRNTARSSGLKLLALAVLAAAGLCPLPARALTDGELTTGSVTGAGTQTYSYYVGTAANNLTNLGMGVPTTDAKFNPIYTLKTGGGTTVTACVGGAGSYGCYLQGVDYTLYGTGTYSDIAKNGSGSTYTTFVANFTMNLAEAGFPFGTQASGGGTMSTGQTYDGQLQNANYDMWTFAANSGDTPTLTMTGVVFTYKGQIRVYRPDGSFIGTFVGSNGGSVTKTLSAAEMSQTGTYMVVIADSAPENSPTYTLKVTNNTALPTDGKEDGSCCGGNGPATTDSARQSYPPGSLPFTPSPAPAPQQLISSNQMLSSDGQPVAGRPVNIATGNMYESVTDYSTVGTNKLAFIRSYNSMSWQHNLYASALGPNWRHNYDRYLRSVSSSLLQAERPDGRVINFKLVSSVWTPDKDVDFKLTNSGSTYTLTDPDDTVETYTLSSGKGTLNSIAYANGYTQTLTYTSGNLTSVSDSYSRTLTLSYTSGKLTGVSTPDSATLTYGYTTTKGQNLLTSITYNTSPSTSQTYVYGNSEYPFALTSITDENGNTNAQWTYDGTGRCTDTKLAGGASEIQISYDDVTGNRTVTGPLGESLTYKFTTSQGVKKVSEIDRAANSPVASATENFTYDSNGYLATATDWNGNSTHWTNNSHGQPTSITEAYGAGPARTTTVTYDSTWVHKPYTTTKTNVTIDDRYDGTTGTLTSHTLKDTTGGSTNNNTEIWAYTYNGTGEMLTETFPRTGTTVKNTYTYSSGALASITDQLSHAWTVNTANGTGQPTEITDPNSVVTDFVYNNRNWLTSKTVNASPSNEVTTYTYEPSGQRDLVTLPDSSTIDHDYDTAQRLTTITNTAGETINYTLNAAGKPTTVTFKDSGGTTKKSFTATYDVLGDMLTLVGAGGAGQTTTYAYDGMMNRTSTTDANSKEWQQTWDELLRPTTVTDPLTHTAAPTYNNLDYVTAQTDFLGYSTSYTRDAFGNAIARSSPDSGSWSFTFNEDNKLTAVTDARSTASSLTYDAVDRLTALSITGYSGEAEAFTYDDTTSGNKGVGRLTSWSDESGSGSRVYDSFGNITSETRVINSKTYTTSYSYDLANRLTEIIYPSGRYVDYTYDSSGYLTTVTTKPSSGGSVTTLASSIVHKPFGPIASFTYGNSEALTKTYDSNYWLTALNTVYSGTYVQELSYGQDNAGNLTSITDTLDSTRNETFTVDDLNRLHTASGKYGSRTYTYDNNSGRATRVAGATTYTTTRVTSKNLVDHITDGTNTENFTWTANGNMATDDRVIVSGGSASFTYGGRNKLESMSVNSQAITYKLNAFGQRVSEAFSGSTTHFIHDIRGNIIAEANGSTGTTTQEYVWMEGELLAQIDGSGNIVYVHNNQVAAPQKITNPSRTVVWDQIIEPFSEVYSTPTNTTPTNIRFPGQYANSNNSLSHNNARDYFPWGGFYAETDPVGLMGGYNPLAYAAQNPLQNIDPLGLSNDPMLDIAMRQLGPQWNESPTQPELQGGCETLLSGACKLFGNPLVGLTPEGLAGFLVCEGAVALSCHAKYPDPPAPPPPPPKEPPCDNNSTTSGDQKAGNTAKDAPSGPGPLAVPTPPASAPPPASAATPTQ
jgi:RHS repeat-associated protein